jgi:hypothetical protein
MDTIIGVFARGGIACCTYTSCQCYRSALSYQNSLFTRFWHIIIFIFYIGSAWVLHNDGYEIVKYFPILNNLCPEDICPILLIYRLSFAIFIFHFTLALILYGSYKDTDPRSIIQNQSWQIKFPYLLILLVISAFIPESFFRVYGWITLFGALLFLLIQLFLVVDFAHTCAELSIINEVDENKHHNIIFPIIAVSSMAMYLFTIALFTYMIFLLEELQHCHINIIIIGLNILIVLIVVIISHCGKFQSKNPYLGTFQASVISLFTTFITWNAVIVNDPSQCTAPFVNYGIVYWITIILGSLYTIGLIIYSSIPTHCPFGELTDSLNSLESYSYSKVNLFFALGSMYIAMIMTNWSVIRLNNINDNSSNNNNNNTTEYETSLNWVPVILNVGLLVGLNVIYIWTVVSPLLCPSRDFNSIKGYNNNNNIRSNLESNNNDIV